MGLLVHLVDREAVATLHIRDVPDETQHAAKVRAAQRRQSLREFVIEAIDEHLERTAVEAQDEEQ
jgi:plasmid stability protein